MIIEHVMRTNVGLVREINQDSVLELPERQLFVVADGMGGEQAGEEASAQVVKTLKEMGEDFFETPPMAPGQIEAMMRNSLIQANTDVFAISVREPEKRGLGSTATMLCLHKGVYFVAHVGDSRIYLMRKGDVRQVTRDHTLVWMLYEQGALTRDQLETHPERHLLTQCIGTPKTVKVDTLEGQLEPEDLFLICSDGLTGYASEAKVFKILTDEKTSLEERADRLVQAALDAGGGDNVSLILIRVAALDAVDQWRAEATGPPEALELSGDETIVDDEMRPHVHPPRPRGKAAVWIPAAALVVGLLGWLAFVSTRSHDTKVYLRATGAGAPAEFNITALKNEIPLPQLTLHKDPGGSYFVLPGAGKYEIDLEAAGYMPLHKTLDIPPKSAQTALTPGEWVKKAQVTLQLPSEPQPTRVQVLPYGSGPEDKPSIELDHGALAGKQSVTLWLDPDARYWIIVDADGHDSYSEAVQFPAGATPVLMVYFK